MSLTLTDELLNVYTFPATFKVTGFNWKKKIRQVPIAFRDGGDEIGDKKLDTRVLSIEGIISDNATYAATMATINSWLYKTNLKLSITAGKHINVKSISDVNNTFYEGGFFRLSKLKFNCICPDPFFYTDAVVTTTKVIAVSPYVFNITNSSLFDVLPVFVITNAVDNFDLNVENATDVGKYFKYTDPGFVALKVLTVDNKAGTVRINGINSIQYYSGSWLRLLPGVNTIVYTGLGCSLKIDYYDLEL